MTAGDWSDGARASRRLANQHKLNAQLEHARAYRTAALKSPQNSGDRWMVTVSEQFWKDLQDTMANPDDVAEARRIMLAVCLSVDIARRVMLHRAPMDAAAAMLDMAGERLIEHAATATAEAELKGEEH